MYHPESYWNEVAGRISKRKDQMLAGDDEPYYRYKRHKFLKLLDKIDFQDKAVLEIGSGPGGNLHQILKRHPQELHGIDISNEMVELSKGILNGKPVTIKKVDGEHIPYEGQYFDIAITSTVLQHNTDESMLKNCIHEICRVTKNEIYIFERIENKIRGTELCLGRPVYYYQQLFKINGFELREVKFLNIQVSYLISGAIRKLFATYKRKEGEPIPKIALLLQTLTLPVTSFFDNVVKTKREEAMLYFVRVGEME